MSLPPMPPDAYLIVARYSYPKWRALSHAEHEAAERAAEDLFPEEDLPLPQHTASRASLPDHLQDVHEVRTFALNVHVTMYADYGKMRRMEKVALLDPIYNANPRDLEAGWMAIVDPAGMAAFLGVMGGHGGALWKMYDVSIRTLPAGWTMPRHAPEVPLLNDDKTTYEIYLNMAIRGWN